MLPLDVPFGGGCTITYITIVIIKLLMYNNHCVCSFSQNVEPEEEPKFLVFYSVLLNLFSMFCFKCRNNKPSVKTVKNGTMVTMIQNCPECGDGAFKWDSQPLAFGKYPMGNMMLSFGILLAGASVSKILLTLKHIGISAISIRTFFRHQKKFILPSILKHWEAHQGKLLSKIRSMENVTWSGDGRFDSMGHSAKYCCYSMFCSPLDKLVHFELLQVCYVNTFQQTFLVPSTILVLFQ